MDVQGKVWKDKNYWLVEVPALNVMTQGKTRADALRMIQDAIIELVSCYYKETLIKNFQIIVESNKNEVIGIASNNSELLMAFLLKRQREMSGSTIREASERLDSKSPNAYAQYERGIRRYL
jgi:predicted RNase H-like HicB family nuclease